MLTMEAAATRRVEHLNPTESEVRDTTAALNGRLGARLVAPA